MNLEHSKNGPAFTGGSVHLSSILIMVHISFFAGNSSVMLLNGN
jgi:hypothetical protein